MTNTEVEILLWKATRRVGGPGSRYTDRAKAARARLGREIVRRRYRAGWSLTELAVAAGIPPGTANSAEHGRGAADRLRRLLTLLQAKIDALTPAAAAAG